MPNIENGPHGPEIASTAAARDPRACVWCGEPFVPARDHARFCPGDACRKAWNNLNTKRGGPVMPFLLAWHATRHAKPGTREAEINRYARREMTEMARAFNATDAEDGRGSVLDYVGALMDAGSIYADRVRR